MEEEGEVEGAHCLTVMNFSCWVVSGHRIFQTSTSPMVGGQKFKEWGGTIRNESTSSCIGDGGPGLNFPLPFSQSTVVGLP
ncbi:unnamed protein product, partial [Choristocarpus tenellus]